MNSSILSLLIHIFLIILLIFTSSNFKKEDIQRDKENYLSVSLHSVYIKDESKKVNNIVNEMPIKEKIKKEEKDNKKEKTNSSNKNKKPETFKINENPIYDSYNKKLDNILDYYKKVEINKFNKIKEDQKKNNNTILEKENIVNNKIIKKINKKDNKEIDNNIKKHLTKVKYIKKIRNKIYSNWQQDGEKGLYCYVEVFQNKFGSVINVDLSYCKNSNTFKSSIKKAIYLSSPFPLPKEESDFQTKLSFTFIIE